MMKCPYAEKVLKSNLMHSTTHVNYEERNNNEIA